jgi:hypothetical protein
VREVRNGFAHSLEADTFEKLEKRARDRVSGAYIGVYNAGEAKGKTLREQFQGVSFFAIAGLRFYRFNVALLNRTIRHDRFEAQLRGEARREMAELVAEMKAHAEASAKEPPKTTS